MVLIQALKTLKFDGHIAVMFDGRYFCGGNAEKVIKKCGYYEIESSCIRDNVLILYVK